MQHLPDLVAGMVIANRFRLESLLGQGGMGSVWTAQHLTLNVQVAVKFVDPTLGAAEEVRSRFGQEAQSAAKINSPHVVRMVDYGTDEWGRPYIAMERLHGEELAKRLERQPTLPMRDVSRVVSHAAKGLTKAHQAGITHRDLKPENLFLVEDEDGFIVKILDFGIAKADSPIGGFSHRTGTGQIVGTPAYMSPEQALGTGHVDARSDLYSLAVVAYRCVTGKPPFESAGLGELIVAITSRPHVPPSSLRPEVTPAVDAWFARAMAKDASQRFQTAKEMADALVFACGFSGASGAFSAPGFAPSPHSYTAMPGSFAPPAAHGGGFTPAPSSFAETQPLTEVSAGLLLKPATLMGSASNNTHDDDPPVLPQRSPVPMLVGAVVLMVVIGIGAAVALRGGASAAQPFADTSAQSQPSRPPPAASSSAAPPPVVTVAPPVVVPVTPPPTAPVAAPPVPGNGKGGKPGKPGDAKPPGPGKGDDKPPPTPPPPTGPKDYGL